MLDIDDFKLVNDSYGHQQGDEVLAQVAGVLRGLSRDLDAPARYGGEELAVVLPQTDAEGAALLAERMRAAVEALQIPRVGGRRVAQRHGELRRGVGAGERSRPGQPDRGRRRRALPRRSGAARTAWSAPGDVVPEPSVPASIRFRAMGILDDAIREHLELKRRHGVPEEEVERQEEEALGPARRDVAQQPEDGEIAADAGDDTSLFDGDHGDAPAAEAPAVADDETAIAEPPATEEPLGLRSCRRRAEEPPGAAEPTSPDAPRAESPPAEPPAAEAPPEPDPHEALGDTEPHGFPALDEEDEDDAP